jgi:predicted ribosome quality control (RQC) complex YloA/Tae2 family protein
MDSDARDAILEEYRALADELEKAIGKNDSLQSRLAEYFKKKRVCVCSLGRMYDSVVLRLSRRKYFVYPRRCSFLNKQSDDSRDDRSAAEQENRYRNLLAKLEERRAQLSAALSEKEEEAERYKAEKAEAVCKRCASMNAAPI